MKELEYKTMKQIQLDIIKKIMNAHSSPISITRCYETLFGRTIYREANEDGVFEIRR
jgi:hypothetical protein